MQNKCYITCERTGSSDYYFSVQMPNVTGKRIHANSFAGLVNLIIQQLGETPLYLRGEEDIILSTQALSVPEKRAVIGIKRLYGCLWEKEEILFIRDLMKED